MADTPIGQKILVVHNMGRHYVIRDVSALNCEQEDIRFATDYVAQPNVRWSRTRADSLVLAHNMQNSLKTEYGVHELFLGENKRKRELPEDESAMQTDSLPPDPPRSTRNRSGK